MISLTNLLLYRTNSLDYLFIFIEQKRTKYVSDLFH